MLRSAGRRPRSAFRRHASLRGGSRRSARLSQGAVRSFGGWDLGLYILVHAGVPVAKSREEEDVLGAVGAPMQIAVRTGRHRGTGDWFLRMLQRLRRCQPLVGADSRKSLHAESRLGAIQVRTFEKSRDSRARERERELVKCVRQAFPGRQTDMQLRSKVLGQVFISEIEKLHSTWHKVIVKY